MRKAAAARTGLIIFNQQTTTIGAPRTAVKEGVVRQRNALQVGWAVRRSKLLATCRGFAASKKVSWGKEMRDWKMRARGRSGAIRVAALALCLLTFLFVVQTASHSHASGKNDSACQLCRTAHIGISAAPASGDVPLPLIQRDEVSQLVVACPLELFLDNAPSRAPPSA